MNKKKGPPLTLPQLTSCWPEDQGPWSGRRAGPLGGRGMAVQTHSWP